MLYKLIRELQLLIWHLNAIQPLERYIETWKCSVTSHLLRMRGEALDISSWASFFCTRLISPGFNTAYDKVMGAHLKEKSKQNGILEDIANIIQMGTPAYQKESQNFLQPIIEAILEYKSIRTVYHSQGRKDAIR